jgi:hypothetical protein
MRVSEILTFEQYWMDLRFQLKKPNLCGSVKQAFGDNIYHRDPVTGRWLQENSHHSLSDGRPNKSNIEHDTHSLKVAISDDFVYWGGSGPQIRATLRDYDGYDVCTYRPGHKSRFPEGLVTEFVAWIRSFNLSGYVGEPADFPAM